MTSTLNSARKNNGPAGQLSLSCACEGILCVLVENDVLFSIVLRESAYIIQDEERSRGIVCIALVPVRVGFFVSKKLGLVIPSKTYSCTRTSPKPTPISLGKFACLIYN